MSNDLKLPTKRSKYPTDLTGITFGKLLVIDRLMREGNQDCWMCECSCEKKTWKKVGRQLLVSGSTKSCGCLKMDSNKKRTHGESRGRIYTIWMGIRARCYNPNATSYKNYGGRGIKMSDSWLTSYENFRDDMGKRPSTLYSVERVDVNGDYTKDNCVWATQKQQSNNTRTTVRLEYNGENLTLGEWSEKTGLSKKCIQSRLNRGWTVARALTGSIMEFFGEFLEFDGKRMNISQWSEFTNIKRGTLQNRLKSGWTVEEALTTPIGKNGRVGAKCQDL